MQTNLIPISIPDHQMVLQSFKDYSDILKDRKLEYVSSGYYWQVGKTSKVQGWIIHLSVIKTQIEKLIYLVLPELLSKRVCFKIVRDSTMADTILEGGFGPANTGKILCIYPNTDKEAADLSRTLIDLTASLKGPAIRTDMHLGAVVYTRYGSINPIIRYMPEGQAVKFINDIKGELVPDPYSIPFLLPKGISWPYSEIINPTISSSKLLNYSYYPIKILKPDAKGDVIKALYFKNIFNIKTCIIKQGRHCMITDITGRDMKDRLKWQFDLYHLLHQDIPIPEVFDYFTQHNDSYLAMAYIKGISFTKWMHLTCQGRSWQDLSPRRKAILLTKFSEIIDIISRLHQKGYIHRDITPENFLIDKTGNIYLIDLELVWSSSTKRPDPPFRLGTPGFISPEQLACSTPTVKEDIYAIGSFMIMLFTAFLPLKFEEQPTEQLREIIFFLTGDVTISDLIANCLSPAPAERPLLLEIKLTLKGILDKLSGAKDTPISTNHSLPIADFTKIIQLGVNGLVNPLLTKNSIWYSKSLRDGGQLKNEQTEFAFNVGWHTGVMGPLWLLARAKESGYDIGALQDVLMNSWEYVKLNHLGKKDSASLGLFMGSAGVAVSLSECLTYQLLSDSSENLELLNNCFLHTSSSLTLSGGVAGQGLALLGASKWISSNHFNTLLNTFIHKIISSQSQDGSWDLRSREDKRSDIMTGLSNGVAGITWFLLAAYEYTNHEAIRAASLRSLNWLIKKAQERDNTYAWPISTNNRIRDIIGFENGSSGIALVFIKAYELLKDPRYQQMAEGCLHLISPKLNIMDFTLGKGLSGLGEIYLEAHKVFNNSEWLERADWIANLFEITLNKNTESWISTEDTVTTADLFSGSSGILHFLIRYSLKGKWAHPLNVQLAKKAQ